MLEDVNFANHMYTKISDLKFNKSLSNNEEKLKYNEYNFDRMIEDNNIKSSSSIGSSSSINNKNTDLDYLYYEENNKVSKKKNKVKKQKKEKKTEDNNEEKNKNKEIRLYILLFVLFCFLNSYFMINMINSYKIQYKLSLAIRASLFLILYYIIKRFF